MKLRHLQTIQNHFFSKNVKDITSIHAAALSEARHTPRLGALSANVASQTDARDGLVHLQHLGQSLEAAMDQS